MERLDTLVAATWQGAVLGVVVFGICRLFPRIPARFRALLWWAVCLKMVCVVLTPATLPLPVLPAQKEIARSVPMALLAPELRGNPAPGGSIPPPGSVRVSHIEPEKFDPLVLVFGVWLAGIVGIAGYLAFQVRGLVGTLRRSTPVPQGVLAEEARRLGVEFGLARRPEIRLSDEVSAPMVVQPWRPIIVLPTAFAESVEPNEARMALAHELSHVRRGDLWLAVVPAAAQALLWFHPVAWFVAREWATERESACDAEALVATDGSPVAYGRLLMKIVSDDHRGGLAHALGATAAYHTLKRRLNLMKSFVPRPTRALRFGGAAFAVAALFAALPWEVTAQTAAVKEPKNLVVNGGFESGLDNWQMMMSNANRPVNIDASIDRSEHHSGKASLKFTKTEVSFFPLKVFNQEVSTVGMTRRLKVGMWVKASQARKATMAVIMDDNIEWGGYVGEAKDGDKPADHDWRYYTATVNVPEGTSHLTIGLQMYGPGTVWMDDVSAKFMPNNTPLVKAVNMESDADPLADVKDVPNQDLKAGNDPLKRYFLIGKPVATANKLLVVLPGGDGSADFNPFLRRVWKNALPEGYLLAQVVAPQWSENQKESIVWPTKKVRWTGMKFSTEELIEAVVKDASAKASIDPSKVYVLGWSSGGPAVYAAALGSPVVKGAFVAMSVYYPTQLPAPSGGRDKPFYLFQSPDDTVTTYGHALTAQKELTSGGAKVTLVNYKGGHGWTDDPFGNIRKALLWLEANTK
jgi:beta-lactamase regulating signal transducer with metallopeptidase domain/predicted esterase